MKKYKKAITKYFAAAAFCILFGTVYEMFSHQVYTPYMYLAWLIPFAGGALPLFLLGLFRLPRPSWLSLCLHACGIATLTIGSIMHGVLVIYGTTNRLMIIYLIAGLILAGIGICSYILALAARAYARAQS